MGILPVSTIRAFSQKKIEIGLYGQGKIP